MKRDYVQFKLVPNSRSSMLGKGGKSTSDVWMPVARGLCWGEESEEGEERKPVSQHCFEICAPSRKLRTIFQSRINRCRGLIDESIVEPPPIKLGQARRFINQLFGWSGGSSRSRRSSRHLGNSGLAPVAKESQSAA